MERCHVLLVALPAQSHINPALQFAKKLISMGIHVTFATTISARRRMAKASAADITADGLALVAFSDGFDDGYKLGNDDADKFTTSVRRHGSQAISDTIYAAAREGNPVTCVVHTLLIPWASEVARELHLPCALLWIQSATVLSIYHHYFNGFQSLIGPRWDDPSWRIRFPGTPLLSKSDVPSVLDPSDPSSGAFDFALASFKEQLDALDRETKPRVLVNSLDALEADALHAIDKYDLIAVGPLIPSEKSFGGDLFVKSNDCIKWLDSQPDSSVVYVSFGSLLSLEKPQVEEIAKGLLDSGRPFLWVNRDEHESSITNDLEGLGKIVPWCSQLEVLRHPSVGCFVSHCGWNSTLESLSCGVPVVAFPQWADQVTNAKLIEDVWKTGVRVRFSGCGIIESGEIWRCVEEVMMVGGDKSREVRKNAQRWKVWATQAAGENGSSTKNLKAFFDLVKLGH